MIVVLAFLIGSIAGLRAMTAPAAVAWAAFLGWLGVAGTWAGFMASPWAVGIFSLLALTEFVTDQLPGTPSRKVPPQFAARLISGGFCGAVLAAAPGGWVLALVAGVAGAVAGTLGGASARGRLAASFGRDSPAALTEDAVAVIAGLLIAAAA
jgi:uncharacterized membrane protein